MRACETKEQQVSEKVATTGEVPEGSMARFEFQGSHIAIANVGGSFYAIDDACTHMGCPLSATPLEGTSAVCSCHGSKFDVSNGAVVHGPARRPVQSFSVEVVGDDLMVEAASAD